MAAITKQDYENLFESVGRLYECDSAGSFSRVTLAEVSRLVGCDNATFNFVAPTIPKVTVVGPAPVPGQHCAREKTLAKYVADEPVLKHYLATGDAWAYKISDFLSARQYHSLPLYKHLYHDLRYEDQFAFMLFTPGSELISVALARDRRSFTERDRHILNLLRPCVARTYRRVEQLERLNPAACAGGLPRVNSRVTTVLLDAQDRAVRFGNGAMDWISHFFPEARATASSLPDIIKRWLRGNRNAGTDRTPTGRNATLVRELEGQRLCLRVIPGLQERERIIVFGLQPVSSTAQKPVSQKLTRREIEVLLEVEQGKSNDEAGAALGISSLTVRTHLEHIFQKLQVPCRTAAVTQFLRLGECICLAACWLHGALNDAGVELQELAI